MRLITLALEVRLGIKNLSRHGLRSFLTMLGVVFGVGSVVAMLAVGEGASKEALEQIRRLGSNNILIRSVKPAEESGAARTRTFMSVYGLLYEDAERIAETFDSVRRTVPAKVLRKEGRLGERSLELRLVGTTPEWFELVRRPVVAGRVLWPRMRILPINLILPTTRLNKFTCSLIRLDKSSSSLISSEETPNLNSSSSCLSQT